MLHYAYGGKIKKITLLKAKKKGKEKRMRKKKRKRVWEHI
jgi:hypothetical protein